MKTAYIGIGSNLGDKLNNCLKAIEMINRIPDYRLTGQSDWYRTEPVGVECQDWYINGVLSLDTNRSAKELLRSLLGIEADLGRIRRKRWESRLIDLDILLYGEDIIDENTLTIPHPLMHVRKFVLVPMTQLAPDLVHPSIGVTMSELLRQLPENDQVVIPLEEQ